MKLVHVNPGKNMNVSKIILNSFYLSQLETEFLKTNCISLNFFSAELPTIQLMFSKVKFTKK